MNIRDALYEFRRIEEISSRDIWINRIDPAVKIIVTILYLFRVLMIKNISMVDIFGVILYPAIILIFGKIEIKIIIKRLWLLIPLIIGIGAVNLSIKFSYCEVLNTITLMIKGLLCLTGGILLITTTGINMLSLGLQRLRLPQILIIQIGILYRYIELMMEQVYRTKSAYELRTLGKKSMDIKDYGSIIGQMLLKSIDRSERVYYAMKLRGFKGEYYHGKLGRVKLSDYSYLFIWSLILYGSYII